VHSILNLLDGGEGRALLGQRILDGAVAGLHLRGQVLHQRLGARACSTELDRAVELRAQLVALRLFLRDRRRCAFPVGAPLCDVQPQQFVAGLDGAPLGERY
jgi:hypothetical protein